MWSSPAFLKQCQLMARAGLFKERHEGSTIARAVADAGFEEFALLSEDTLTSLLNGGTTRLSPGQGQFFFEVPTVSKMVNEIQLHYFDVLDLEFHEQRVWRLTIRDAKNKKLHSFEEETIETVLASALLDIVSVSQ
jgi:hypothetical protein